MREAFGTCEWRKDNEAQITGTVGYYGTLGISPDSGTGNSIVSDGSVTFSLKSKAAGTYILEVMEVIHTTLTYAPRDNVETSESISVP